MLLPVYFGKSLNKDIRKAIKNREYTHEQLVLINKEVSKNQLNDNKGLHTAITVALFTFILMRVLSFSKVSNKDPMLSVMSILPVLVIVALIFFMKINFVDKPKRQFLKAVKRGYPEYYDEFNGKN